MSQPQVTVKQIDITKEAYPDVFSAIEELLTTCMSAGAVAAAQSGEPLSSAFFISSTILTTISTEFARFAERVEQQGAEELNNEVTGKPTLPDPALLRKAKKKARPTFEAPCQCAKCSAKRGQKMRLN